MYNLFRVGKIWHYRFQVDRKRVQKTTRHQEKGRAEKVAQRAFDDAVVRANGGQPIPTLSCLAEDWLEVRGPGVSASHVRGIEVLVRRHLYDLGPLPINELTTVRIELARNKHLETCSPATANHWLRLLKLIVNWGVKREILPKLPWNVDMLRVQKRPRATLEASVIGEWFAALDAGSHRSISTAVRLMFSIGLREQEAASARWEWIDWQRKTYTPGITKGSEAQPLAMPNWLVEYLTPLRCQSGFMAPSIKGTQMPPGFARRAMRHANSVCAVERITPHRLRGTFATLLADEGASIQNIQRAMRHKDVKTTMGYLEVNMDRVAQAQNRIGDKIGFRSDRTGPPGIC